MTEDHEQRAQHQQSESRPLLGRRMARFNLLVTNRLALPLAGRLPGFGVVMHTGRRTGRIYRTPVLLFRSPNGHVVIALTYGRNSQWVKNVLAAGGCRLITRGRELRASQPELFRDPRRSSVPGLVRFMLTLLRVEDFLRFQVLPAETRTPPSTSKP
jgi:deazaflavin-dependent oxidoreductase (nitroreductase family)